jgi:hypothetical protein
MNLCGPGKLTGSRNCGDSETEGKVYWVIRGERFM